MNIRGLVDAFFNWDVWRVSFPVLLSGIKVTLGLAAAVLAVAALAGLAIALARNLKLRRINWMIVACVDILRAFPPLVLLGLIYFGLPFVGIRFAPLAATILAMSLNNGAHFSETFRSGIDAVGKGQIDASRALGLTGNQTMAFIVVPQAVRIVIPALTSNTVALIKDTALASVVTVPELLYGAREQQSLYFNPSPMMAATLIYLLMLIPLVRLTGILEARLRKGR